MIRLFSALFVLTLLKFGIAFIVPIPNGILAGDIDPYGEAIIGYEIGDDDRGSDDQSQSSSELGPGDFMPGGPFDFPFGFPLPGVFPIPQPPLPPPPPPPPVRPGGEHNGEAQHRRQHAKEPAAAGAAAAPKPIVKVPEKTAVPKAVAKVPEKTAVPKPPVDKVPVKTPAVGAVEHPSTVPVEKLAQKEVPHKDVPNDTQRQIDRQIPNGKTAETQVNIQK